MIAIRELSEQDIKDFERFRDSDRIDLFDLKLADLVKPHESLAVVACEKNNMPEMDKFAEKYKYCMQECEKNIYTISHNIPHRMADNSTFLFSGYCFYNGKFYIGEKEIYENIDDLKSLKNQYGEFNLCIIRNNEIYLLNDYFNMSPWFYYNDESHFVVSNSYHMLLLILVHCGIELNMNIPRSRVNVITSGFNFGSAFTNDLDVSGCKILSPFDTLTYNKATGVRLCKSLLGKDVLSEYEWDEIIYEKYIRLAAKEIEQNCEAILAYEGYKNIVCDISGGFDSRIVLAAITRCPRHLREKVFTYTRASGTKGDVEVAATVTNMFNFKKWTYGNEDPSRIYIDENTIYMPNISRTLGTFAVNSYLYCAEYYDMETLELTGGMGDACFGYKRIRGELNYELGDQKLLARMGGCYLHNCVTQLKDIFEDQKKIINNVLGRYSNCNCLFKKIHIHYLEFRNRFNFGSAHLIEHNNFRVPMAFSRFALMAKMMYFSKFENNNVPDEKISFDILNELNPIMALLPFTSNNDDVIPVKENLLKPIKICVNADKTIHPNPPSASIKGAYQDFYIAQIEDIYIAEKMLLNILDFSDEYYPSCLGLYKVLSLLKKSPEDLHSAHGRETIRKIYDLYFQINIIKKAENKRIKNC